MRIRFAIATALILCRMDGSAYAQIVTNSATSEVANPSPQSLDDAFMVAQVVTLQGAARLKHLRGACYVVREETASRLAREGQSVRDGDLLDLGDDCSLRVTVSGRKDLILSHSNGRFYKLKINK